MPATVHVLTISLNFNPLILLRLQQLVRLNVLQNKQTVFRTKLHISLERLCVVIQLCVKL